MTQYELDTLKCIVTLSNDVGEIKNLLKTYFLRGDSNTVLNYSKEENTVGSKSICPAKSDVNVRLIDRLNSIEEFKLHILGKFQSKFKAINFEGDPRKPRIGSSKTLVVLCTIQTRIEDSCNFAMEGLPDCESVVLVVFRRITRSDTLDSICSCYHHPRVSRTIFAGFDEKDIYFSRADEEFLEKESEIKDNE